MLTIPQYAFIGVMLFFSVGGLLVGYALGLRETKRRLKAHQEVTDRLMGKPEAASTNDFYSALLGAGLGGTYHTYGGISRSSSPFTAAGIRNQAGLIGGAGMQNAIITQRGDARSRFYEALKKAME